jgi:DNA-binding helix-turn-helix protein
MLLQTGGKMTTVKQKRTELGYTQKQVAKEAGICERQYIRIENGEMLPNVKTAYRISTYFQSTIEECFKDILTQM